MNISTFLGRFAEQRQYDVEKNESEIRTLLRSINSLHRDRKENLEREHCNVHCTNRHRNPNDFYEKFCKRCSEKREINNIHGYFFMSGYNIFDTNLRDNQYFNGCSFITDLNLEYWFFNIMLKKNQNIEKISFSYDKEDKTLILRVFSWDYDKNELKLYARVELNKITKKEVIYRDKNDTLRTEYMRDCHYITYNNTPVETPIYGELKEILVSLGYSC